MRRPFLCGNWKMNLTLPAARRLAEELKARLVSLPDRDVAVFPTALALPAVASILEQSPIQVGGQNCHQEDGGAFTGELSAPMFKAAGASLIILGHSERRQLFGESATLVGQKLCKALEHRLQPILCVGETQAERQAGRTLEVVEGQLVSGLSGVPSDRLLQVSVAYEPVWAIGTGAVATPEQAQEIHQALRRRLKELAGPLAEEMRILYGGSVKGENVDGLMAQTDIDGALVGGASLHAAAFERIVNFQAA